MSFKKGNEPETVATTDDEITAIDFMPGRLYFATGRKVYKHSLRTKETSLVMEAEEPLTTIKLSNIR